MATKKPTAKQLAARAKFAAMARSGALAKKRKKAAPKKTVAAKKTKRNPIAPVTTEKSTRFMNPRAKSQGIRGLSVKEISADYEVRVSEGKAADGGPGKWRTVARFPQFKEAKEYAVAYADAHDKQMSVVNLKKLSSWY